MRRRATSSRDPGANIASEDEEKKVLTSVAFLTMVDDTSGSTVAKAVQKKKNGKFVEGSRVIQGDWRHGAPDGAKKNGTDRCGKTRGS